MNDVLRGGKHLGCRLRWDLKRMTRIWSHLNLLKSIAFRSCPLGLGFMKCMERHNMDCNKLVVRVPSAPASMLCIQLCLLEANRENLTSTIDVTVIEYCSPAKHVLMYLSYRSFIRSCQVYPFIALSREAKCNAQRNPGPALARLFYACCFERIWDM